MSESAPVKAAPPSGHPVYRGVIWTLALDAVCHMAKHAPVRCLSLYAAERLGDAAFDIRDRIAKENTK